MALANLALRFLLELGGFAAVAFSAYQLVGGGPAGWIAGIGAALLLVAMWSLVVAPKAAIGLSQPQKDVIGTSLLLMAAAMLALAGQTGPAIGFAGLVVVNAIGLVAFGPETRDRLTGTAQ